MTRDDWFDFAAQLAGGIVVVVYVWLLAFMAFCY